MKTAIICAYIVHKIWWKRQQKVRTVKRGTQDWNRVIGRGA